MTFTKYSKYLFPAPFEPGKYEPFPIFNFSGDAYGVNASFSIVPTTKPVVAVDKPHQHNFHQFICFLGGDPYNISNLGAEVNMALGQEGEEHVITSPTMIHITPGLVHCPLEYRRIDQPIYAVNITFTPEYVRTPVSS